MHVLSAAEMQACDRATTEQFGVPSILLMRAASAAVAEFARRVFPQAKRVTVLCGRGNNGGDGMMAARLLVEAGLDVTTLLLGAAEDLKGDAAHAWAELTSPMQGRVHIVNAAGDLVRHKNALEADLILDAVVGTGFKPPLKGLALAALAWLRESRAPILAVDLPSGWPADETSATIADPVFPADAVVTFTAPKPAHVFGQLTRRWNQPVVVAPINFYASHQWLRELKRRNQGSIAGIYFRIPDEQLVWIGHYGQAHRLVAAAEAVAQFANAEDPVGWEVVIPRRIDATEIHKTRPLPQVIGWRFPQKRRVSRRFALANFVLAEITAVRNCESGSGHLTMIRSRVKEGSCCR